MGFLPCPPFCNSEKEKESNSNPIVPPESSTFLSSQASLPSVPSLASPSQRHDEQVPTVDHRCISTLKGHKSYVFSLILAGKHLYSGSYDNEIRVWSRDSKDSTNTNNNVATGNGAVKSLAVFEDKLFSAHQDHKIRVWKINNDDDSNPRKYHCIATLPTTNNRLLSLFSAKNYVQVRRHKMCTWVHHVDTVSALAISDDGSLLYSASWDRTFKVWKTSKNFRCLESVANAHDDAINALSLSKDGYVYTASADKKIKVWKRHSNSTTHSAGKKHSLVATLEKHRSGVNALALSSDGSVLYSGACDRSIIVWERDNGSGTGRHHMVVVGALRGHTMAILCLAATASDHLLCSGSADKTIRIWKRSAIDKSYSCLAVLEGHTKPVKCLQAISVDATSNDFKTNSAAASAVAAGNSSILLVYSGSLDCNIKVWKVSVPFL